jgi:hypothetical protein
LVKFASTWGNYKSQSWGNFLEEVAQGLYHLFHPSMERKKLRKKVNLKPLG